MTIRLLRPFNGFPTNSVVSLDRATEAALVSQLVATFQLGGGNTSVINDPFADVDKQVQDPVTGRRSMVTTDVLLPFGSGALTTSSALAQASYDIAQARLSRNSSGTLSIPTYDGSGAVVHPSVLYIPTGFGNQGKRWWMAMTPYPGADSAFENPSIVVSDDGLTWTVPAGLTNPIAPYPGGVDYNSDTYLFLDADGQSLICVSRTTSNGVGNEIIRFQQSFDGISWTVPVNMFSYPTATRRLYSPSVWWDGAQYVCLAHDGGQANFPIVRTTAPTLTGPWTTPANVTQNLPPGVTSTWHSDWRRLPGSGAVVGLIQTGSSSGGVLYAAMSLDNGLTLQYSPLLHTRATNGIYKCGFVPFQDVWIAYLGYLLSPTLRVEQGIISFDRDQYQQTRTSYIAAGAQATLPPASQYSLWDSFTRADSAVGLGSSTSGTAWTVESGTLGILSNRAYAPGAGANKSYIALSADFDGRVTFSTLSSGGYFTFRRAGNNDFWRLNAFSGSILLQVIVGAGVAQAWSVTQSVANGDEFRVRARGNAITVFWNGVVVIDISDTRHNTSTGVGLQISDTTARFANMLVSAA